MRAARLSPAVSALNKIVVGRTNVQSIRKKSVRAAFVHGNWPTTSWPTGGGKGMVFEASGTVVSDIREAECDFWDAVQEEHHGH